MNSSHPDLSTYEIDDRWAVSESSIRNLPVIVRIRYGLRPLAAHPLMPHRVRVLWAYESDSEFGLPPQGEMSDMDECENELLRHLETDNLAILTHVLTGDSVRQWVFYSQDIERTVERIQNAMATNSSWNLEATASADDEWEEYVTTLDSLNLDQQDT